MSETQTIPIYPDPPSVRAAPIAVALLGVTHLVVAALVECLQMFNLVIGLVEILIAIWLALELSRGRKKYLARLEEQQRRSTPQPPTGAA